MGVFWASDLGLKALEVRVEGFPERAQYPLIKEYSLNHNKKPYRH